VAFMLLKDPSISLLLDMPHTTLITLLSSIVDSLFFRLYRVLMIFASS